MPRLAHLIDDIMMRDEARARRLSQRMVMTRWDGAMITINNRVRGKDGLLKLSEIAPQIREVFTITKLDKIFEIHDDHEDALKSFS